MAPSNDGWEEVPVAPAGHDGWEEVPVSHEPPGAFTTGLAHALDSATLGSGHRLASESDASLERDAKERGAPAPTTFARTMAEGTKAHPIASAVGDLAGFVVGPGGPVSKGVGAAGKALGWAGRTLAGAASGYGLSGATALNQGASLPQANQAGAQGAMLGGAATAAPLLTAGGLGFMAAKEDDPTKAAQLGVNALALGAGGIGSKFSGLGKMLSAPGEAARAKIAESFVPEAVRETKAANAADLRTAREYSGRLRRAAEPVNGATPGAPGAPAGPDLEATARGKLGAEAQENYRFLRSKDALGLNLSPEAQAGAQALVPDYEASANEGLGKFAGGKEARLKAIIAALQAESASVHPSSQAKSAPAYPGVGQLRPDLMASLASLKPNPVAGVVPRPLPTAATLAPQLAPKVSAEIAAMRAQKGVLPRLLSGAASGVSSPVGAMLELGGLTQGHAAEGLGGAAGMGVLKSLVKDPVLATSVLEPVGNKLQAGSALAKRVGAFLAGATGPVLAKKIQYLKDHDPEFRAAVGAQ